MELFKKINLENIIFLNIIFLPIFLISGPFLTDLAISFNALFFLIISYKKKLFHYYNNKFIIFFLIFYLSIVISSLLSSDIFFSLKSSIFYFRFYLFSLSVWYILEKNENLIHYFFYPGLICFSILIVDGYFQYFSGKNILGYEYDGIRASSLFGEELILGSYLSRLFPIIFASFIYNDSVKKKSISFFIFVGVLFVLTEVLIFLSGERSAIFYLNLSAVFILIMIKRHRIFRLSTLLVSLCLMMIILSNNNIIKKRVVDNTISQIGIGAEEKYIFSYEHDSLYKTSINIYKDNIFFGIGPKNFRNICSNKKYYINTYSCSTHPHNSYIQILTEGGSVAFLTFLIVFLVLIFNIFKHFKKNILTQKYFLPILKYVFCQQF